MPSSRYHPPRQINFYLDLNIGLKKCLVGREWNVRRCIFRYVFCSLQYCLSRPPQAVSRDCLWGYLVRLRWQQTSSSSAEASTRQRTSQHSYQVQQEGHELYKRLGWGLSDRVAYVHKLIWFLQRHNKYLTTCLFKGLQCRTCYLHNHLYPRWTLHLGITR